MCVLLTACQKSLVIICCTFASLYRLPGNSRLVSRETVRSSRGSLSPTSSSYARTYRTGNRSLPWVLLFRDLNLCSQSCTVHRHWIKTSRIFFLYCVQFYMKKRGKNNYVANFNTIFIKKAR